MKIAKKLIILVIFILSIILLSNTVKAAIEDTFIYEGVEYKVLTESGNSGTVEIVDYDNNIAQLTIPEIITYNDKQYTVTNIGYSAFSGCNTLTNIKLPDSIIYIGDNAFGGCSSLTSIKIPNQIKSISYNCFGGCSALVNVELPNSLECIIQSSFSGCSSLKSLLIPNLVTSIEYNAFGGCSSLEKILIPNTVTWIGYNAFGGANSLTIYGETGSVAETYANDNGKTFTTLNSSIYKVINDFVNITSDGDAFIEEGTLNYMTTLSVGFGSTLPSSVIIEMGENLLNEGTDYTYNNITGEIKITKEITNDIKISAKAVNIKKSVNNILTKVQSNGAEEVYPALGNYVANLIADNEYKLPETISVKVGDNELNNTQYKYNSKTGELIIYAKNITDDVTIEVIAVEAIYKVIFNSNGGIFTNKTETLSFENWKYTDYDNLEEPTRKGYIFLGYYNDKDISLDYIMGESGIYEDMTFYAKWEKVELKQIKIFENYQNQEYIKGKDKKLIFILDNDRGSGEVFVDDKKIDKENINYTWEFSEGIYPAITLSEDYLKTLGLGKHTIKFIVEDEFYAETKFTIAEKKIENENNNLDNSTAGDKIKDENSDNPQTGDNIMLYVVILALSVVGIVTIIIIRKHFKNNK